MLFSKFLTEVNNDGVLKDGANVVVAVSGGADSVCLLHFMVRLRETKPIHITCAHLNHGLREEADVDEDFVRKLCEKWNVSFVSHKVNVLEYAKDRNISLELAGREVRYSFFKSLCKDFIITAHTKNDSAESILLHMIRGCGLTGLCGISRLREDGVYRPLLSFERNEIETYLQSQNISWREDKTNAETIYTRNKIRNELLPVIFSINPSFIETANKMALILEEENEFIKKAVAQNESCLTFNNDESYISISELSAMPLAIQRRILSRILENAEEVNAVLKLMQKENGKRIYLSGNKIAEKDYDVITIFPNVKSKLQPALLPLSGELDFGKYKIIVGSEGLALPKTKYFVRCKKPGDIFSPEGMKGHKKIKDFLNEMKIPLWIRDELPIITYNDQIASVADIRRDNAFLPKDDNIIHIKVQKRSNV